MIFLKSFIIQNIIKWFPYGNGRVILTSWCQLYTNILVTKLWKLITSLNEVQIELLGVYLIAFRKSFMTPYQIVLIESDLTFKVMKILKFNNVVELANNLKNNL
jgi:hypothetical protein